MRLVLDLPPRALSPNLRVHWAQKAKAAKYYRTLAMVVARNAVGRAGPEWERAEVRTTFYFPDRRRRDRDNHMAMLKPAWDGLVDARVLTDDQHLIQHPPTMAVDKARPRVEIELTEAA